MGASPAVGFSGPLQVVVAVDGVRGVTLFVGFGKSPASIGDCEIEALKALMKSSHVVVPSARQNDYWIASSQCILTRYRPQEFSRKRVFLSYKRGSTSEIGHERTYFLPTFKARYPANGIGG